MKKTSPIRVLIAVLAFAAVASAGAQTVFFSDTFNRPDNLNLDAATNGMSGILMSSGALTVSNVWLEPADVGSGNDTDSQVAANQLKMGGNAHSVHVLVNKNFANVFSNGQVSVSLDLVGAPGGAAPAVQRYSGFGVAFTLAEGNFYADRQLTRVADLYVAETQNGLIRINDESPSLRPSGTTDVNPTTTVDLDGSTAVFIPGTLRVDMTVTNTAAGSTVAYTVLFNSGSGFTTLASRSFVLSDNNEFYVGAEERSAAAITDDNFTVSATSYTPPPVTALAWRATTDNNWDTTTTNWVDAGAGVLNYAFFTGANVTFNDTTANPSVNVSAPVTPGNLLVNNASAAYVLSGAGSIGGAGTLTKAGNGTLTINLNNNFSGGAILSAGRIRLGSDTGLGTGTVTLGGGTISSVGGTARTLTNAVAVTGASGFGDATDNGFLAFSKAVNLNGASRNLTFNSDALFANGATNGTIGSKIGNATLTIKGNAYFSGSADVVAGTLIYDGAIVTNTARIIVNAAPNLAARLVITNGAVVVNTASNGNLRSGLDAAGGGSNYVDIAGVYSLPNTVLPNGYATLRSDTAYAEMTFWPGGDFTANGVQTYNNGGTVVNNTVFKFNGGILRARSANPSFFQGLAHAYVQSGGAIIDDGGFAITIGQPLETDGSGGGLTKLGSGSLTLAGTCSYTGDTVVSNGTLVITTGTLTGGGGISLQNNAGLSVTNLGSALSVSALTLNPGAGTNHLRFNLPNGNTPGVPTLSAASITAAGPVLIDIAGAGLSLGTFPLLQSGAGISGLANFQLGTVPPGLTATLVKSSTAVSLDISSVVNELEWASAVNSDWDTSTANWYDLGNGGNPTNYTQTGSFGDQVKFDGLGSANVNLALAVTPVSVTVNDDAGGNFYTISGAGKISGGGYLVVNSAYPFSPATVNDFTGGTFINNGFVFVGADQALGTGPVSISAGQLCSDGTSPRTLPNVITLNADTGITLGDLPIGGHTGQLTVGGIDLGGGTTRTLLINSDLTVNGGITNGVFKTKDGPGALRLEGSLQQSVLADQVGGDVIVDGARFDNGDGWRLWNKQVGTTMRLAITNGGIFTITTPSANLRVGLTGGDNGAATLNVLDVAGLVSLVPTTVTANSAVILGQSGGTDLLNLRAGGNVLARAIVGNAPANTEAHFYGGTLTAIANEPAFITGLTNAYMEDGGLTIDTTNFSVTVPQALLALGAGGLTKTGTGTLTLSGANTYSGNTVVNAGKLVLGEAHAAPGGITVNANATLAFLQTTPTNSVRVASVTIGAGANAALEAELAATSAPAGVITNLILNGPVAVNVTGPVKVGQTPLFGYGTISGPGALSLGILPQGDIGHLVTNTLNQTIDLVVDSVAVTLWTGATNSNWDTTTTNWTSRGTPVAYQQLANVLFDDSASNVSVNLAATLTPSSVTISNSALAYAFSGSGILSGSMTLTKNGTNTVDMSTANTFTGNVRIQGGTFRVGTATPLGAAANHVYVTNNGTLDIRGKNLGAQPVIISGGGAGGNGSLINSAADQNDALSSLTLTGDSTLGGIGQIGVRTGADTDPGLVANGHKLVKVGSNGLNLNGGKTVAGLTNVWFADIGDIDIQQGTVSFQRRAALGNPTNTITIESGAAMETFSLNQTLPVPTNSIVMNNGSLHGTGVAGDTNTLGGRITLNGSSNSIGITLWVGTTGPTKLILNGPLVGSGGVIFDGSPSNGVIQLGGNNTYAGNTVISSGTLALAAGNALAGTANIVTVSNATLDVSVVAPWALGAGQTLGGAGTVNGSLVAGGTIAPGNSVGTLTVNGDLTLAGNLAIDVDKSLAQSNDVVMVSGALNNTGSGTLTVSNLNSLLPLAVGDKFTLFNQPLANGDALTVTGGGVTWANHLAADGSIQVAGTSSGPQIGKVTVSGGNLTMSGGGGVPNATYYVLSATNVALPLLDWTPVLTNAYAPDGNFTNSLPVTAGEPKRFYRLKNAP